MEYIETSALDSTNVDEAFHLLIKQIHQKITMSKQPLEGEKSTDERGISKEFGFGKGVKL